MSPGRDSDGASRATRATRLLGKQSITAAVVVEGGSLAVIAAVVEEIQEEAAEEVVVEEGAEAVIDVMRGACVEEHVACF